MIDRFLKLRWRRLGLGGGQKLSLVLVYWLAPNFLGIIDKTNAFLVFVEDFMTDLLLVVSQLMGVKLLRVQTAAVTLTKSSSV